MGDYSEKNQWLTDNGIRSRLTFWLSIAPRLVLFILIQSAYSQASGPITALYSINLNGNRCVIDSYNSSDPNASLWHTNWFYNGNNFGTYTSSLRTANAIVATDGQFIQADGACIYGYVDTSPTGAVSIASGGTVGDLNWIGPNPNSPFNTGIQPGHQFNDMNLAFPSVALPTAATWLSVPSPTNFTIRIGGLLYTNNNNPYNKSKASSYTIGGISYSLFITNRISSPGTPTNKVYYSYPSQLTQSLFIDASNVVLSLPNGIGIISGDNITLNTNASIEIYSGSDITTGNGLVNNYYQYAGALRIYGLPGCQNISFGGNAVLSLSLYAPSASIIFNGGGSLPYDVCGQLVVQNVTINGRYNFHSDEALAANLPFPPWMTSQPLNRAVQVGFNTTFSSSANGTAPLWSQWFLNQTNLISSGTNNFTLSMTNVQLSDTGNYSVVVTNLFGAVTSAPASLIVYTNAAATLSSPFLFTNGVQFSISGVTGLRYAVQVSTNLTDWTSLATNTAPFGFTDSPANLFPQRFYRSLYTPP